MTKNYIFILLVVAMTALLHSCVPKPLDIILPEQQSKMVVSSLIIPNQIMLVSLTRSFTSLSNPNDTSGSNGDSTFYKKYVVDSALVVVSYSGKSDTLFRTSPGIYASLNTLQISGNTYTLYVKDYTSGEEITAQSVMLDKISFDSIRPYIIRGLKDTTAYIKYSFTDQPANSNYYMVNYSSVSQAGSFSKGLPGLNNTNFQDLDLYTENDLVNGRIEREKELNVAATDTINIQLVNISKGFFEFMTAYKRSGKLINQLTGQPINYPSNVRNGYGYFNTHYPDVKLFDLSKY
jgi:hypothetical protein